MTTGRLLALAVASYLVVVVAAAVTPRSCFSPGWFNVLVWIFLPLGLLSTLVGVFVFGLEQGWSLIGTIVGGLLSTALVGVIIVIVLLELTLDSACFSQAPQPRSSAVRVSHARGPAPGRFGRRSCQSLRT